jgi:hypothetical protein
MRNAPAVLVYLSLATGTAHAGAQTPAQAREQDAGIIAAAKGWTTSAVLDMMQDQDTFQALRGEVKDAYPSAYSSGVFAATPTASSSLYFKGSVPAGVADLITASGLSVTTHANTGKNFQEWRAQVDAIAAHLASQGYDAYAVVFDDVNTIGVLIGDGDTLPVLPDAIDDNVTITGTSVALAQDDWVRGGSQMYINNGTTPWCTSSWNVEEKGTGIFGTVSASHCHDQDGVDNIGGPPSLRPGRRSTTVSTATWSGTPPLSWRPPCSGPTTTTIATS